MNRTKSRRRNVFVLGIVLAFMLLASCPCALALDPSLDISQYAHTSWKIRDGFAKGYISSIAQTQDGYIWFGTEFGLLRFDGVRAVPWQPPAGADLLGSNITSLRVAHDGTLWIGTFEGIASWNGTKVSQYPEVAGQPVSTLIEDHEGTIWAGTSGSSGRICAIRNSIVHCYGEDGSLGRFVLSLYEDSRGNLWAGAQTGLWRWNPGPPKLYPMPGSKGQISDIIEGDNGELLFAMGDGIKQLVGGRVEPYPLQNAGLDFKPSRFLRDRNGGFWIGTLDRGLLHVHEGRVDAFAQSDGLSGNSILRLFEDREGTIWVASSDGGLDHFRDFTVSTISANEGLSDNSVWSVLGARDGSVWLGTTTGLNRWKDGQVTVYRKHARAVSSGPKLELNAREVLDNGLPDDSVDSLFQDGHGRIWVSTLQGIAYIDNDRFVPVNAVPAGIVLSITGDSLENLWISDRTNGLIHLFRENVVERIPFAALGSRDAAFCLLTDPVNGGLWIGFGEGGLAYWKDGQVRASYKFADGLGKGRVWGLQFDRDGALWAATEGGLSRIKSGNVATLTSNNGLPCDTVHWMMEDNDHSAWLGTACGLVRIAQSDLDAWVIDAKRKIQVTVFDNSDGVTSHANSSGFSPRVAKSGDGKLWFLPGNGVSVLDPRRLAYNPLPPPVHIEQITADHQTYDAASGINEPLPALTRDLEIDYTALSLVAPEKVRFRVKLEGWDADWKDAGAERKALYSNLPPSNYRFRVIACNNSGVWNEEGSFLDFTILPAFYQTYWFLFLCFAALAGLIWMVFRYRLHQSNARMEMRFNERLAERTRIAQELHDSLLQGVVSSSIRLNVAVDNLGEDSPAKPEFDRIIELMRKVTDEGRNTLRGLRARDGEKSDRIEESFASLRLVPVSGKEINFRVVVEGTSRDLSPIVREEAAYVGNEALNNAYRHSNADNIEAIVEYSPKYLRVLVRDDGKGIDDKFLKSGRVGHWGLTGMRERAERIGAELKIRSRPGAGTEVELLVPGHIAYDKPMSKRSFRWPFKPSAQKLAEPQEQEDK